MLEPQRAGGGGLCRPPLLDQEHQCTFRALTQRQTKRMVSEAPQEIMTAVVGAAASKTRDPMLLLSINTSDNADTSLQRATDCPCSQISTFYAVTC